jgi:hypothetical protein
MDRVEQLWPSAARKRVMLYEILERREIQIRVEIGLPKKK